MTETRNLYEGTLRWVQASGNGRLWTTASGAPSGTFGYVTDFRFASARTLVTVADRGVPGHHKSVGQPGLRVAFDLQWGVTGDYPSLAASGGGATVPMVHLELKSTAPEAGGALVFQFHGVAFQGHDFAVGVPADTLHWDGIALAMDGPTPSGYLG
jgi:hypothetical protein